MTRSTGSLVVVAALALVIAGCTSGGDDASTTSGGATSGTATTAGGTPVPTSISTATTSLSTATTATTTGTSTTSTVTPLVMSAIGEPLVVPGSDGMRHIDYDLLVTDVFTAPLTMSSVTVLDQDGGVVLELAGDALAAVTESNFGQRAVDPPAQVPVSGQVSVEVDVTVPMGDPLPTNLSHEIAWMLPADAPALSVLGTDSGTVTGLPLAVSTVSPVSVAAPLRGSGWTVLQGCCLPNGRRSLRYALDGSHEVKAEMFALDWVRLADGGSFYTGDGSTNADYPYIGSDLLAVADGTVVRVRDDMPNETPNEPPRQVKTGQDYVGNTVVVQIAPDRWATYAHLDPGSVAVRVGDRVSTGDVVGKLGNSGNSTAAHLHFVITDGPDFLTSRSIPVVIDDWTLQGSVTIDALSTPPGPDGPAAVPVTGPSGPQTGTLPLYLSVADFGA